jgi:hypothetical protein
MHIVLCVNAPQLKCTSGLERTWMEYKIDFLSLHRSLPTSCACQGESAVAELSACLLDVLKFNKHCSTFVLFDKKFSILD